MANTNKALFWAALILAAAFICKDAGLNDGASFGITMGMVGAAWGSIQGKRARCSRFCG